MTQVDETCYRYVLQTAAHRPFLSELGPLVDETLTKMRENYMVPDSDCYSAAIRTWKNAALHQPDVSSTIQQYSVRRAIALLAEMDVAHNQSTMLSVKVSTTNINDILDALTVSTDERRFEQAEALLAKLEHASSDDKTELSATADSYIHVLRVWSTAGSIEKIAKVKEILWRVKDTFSVSSSPFMNRTGRLVDIFNEFVQVCGSYRARNENEGLQVLREAFDAIKIMRGLNGLEPNAATYASLLKACTNLLPLGHERRIAVATIFSLCCDDGMVDSEILSHLRSATTSEQYADLVITSSETNVDGTKIVPEAWTAKALGGKVISIDGRKSTPLSVDGRLMTTRAMQEFKMRRLLDKRNRNLLWGGRWRSPNPMERHPWRLYDSSHPTA